MQSFLVVFAAVSTVLNICAVIWLAAVKITRLEVKVEPMWRWFVRSGIRRSDDED